MEIVMRKTESLVPYDRNPRDNDDAAQTVAESIRAFGFKNPIVLDADGVVVCGHARLKAALMLKIDEVPCTVIDDLTPAQIKAFRIADNRTAELAGWDYDALCAEFEELRAEDFDLNLTGFNEFEQTKYGMADAEPDKPDRQRFKEYEQDAEQSVLRSFNIVIHCRDEAEKAALAEIIGEHGKLKRLYRAQELLALRQAV